MYSEIVDGEVLDWRFEKTKGMRFRYTFWIGQYLVGQIFRMSRGRWSAVAPYPLEGGFHHIHGFASRHDAAEFLLRVRRYWLEGERIKLKEIERGRLNRSIADSAQVR